MEEHIAQVVVPVPVEGPFDYYLPEAVRAQASVGSRVYVPFGGRRVVGFIVGLLHQSAYAQLKPILALLDQRPVLDNAALGLARDFAAYYGCTLGESCAVLLPLSLRRKRTTALSVPDTTTKNDQASGCMICHDYSVGEGLVYLFDEIRQTLARGAGVLLLVPEVEQIKATVMVAQKNNLPLPGVLDRRLSVSKELEQWLSVREGKQRFVIGTRSAVFAPVNNLGLLIVLDEENPAYKQEQSPAYHVREVVRMRARREGTKIVFASAAPSAEVWGGLDAGWAVLKSFSGALSPLQLIDLTNYKPRGRCAVSFPLGSRIEETLTAGGKVALFLNRRGRSTFTKCNHCGAVIRCPRCAVTLAYRHDHDQLFCCLCGQESDLPPVCPHCRQGVLRSLGAGIERIEDDLIRIFPAARVATFDSETKSLPAGEIIVGTTALERVLGRLRPALIGVLDIDAQLSRVDFRSAQQVFSSLIRLRRVAGARILVQTNFPEHYALQSAVKGDFDGFYRKELDLRKDFGLPPFQHLLSIILRGEQEEYVLAQARALHERLKDAPDGISVMDAQPDVQPKVRDQYRFVILLKGPSVGGLLDYARAAVREFKRRKNLITTIDVDL